MSTRFDHVAIEAKWQNKWKEAELYKAGQRDEKKEKKFILTEFPYPSGNLHIGHWYAFAVPDIYVRTLRMQGYDVLYPIGFDSFGLPAENAAIKRKLDPKEWTYDNIAYMTHQLESMGNSFDWSRMVITSNPEYYRWTQWIFLQFFKKDLAYRGVGMVNWCPVDNTVLANEQVVDGKCERCGNAVEQREMPEWKMRITQYADRLIDDLSPLAWPEFIKDLQRNWIGRSEGAEITFKLSTGDDLTVFTTRPDTLYGATFCVIAPEHALVQKLKPHITNWDEVALYQKATAQKSDIERQTVGKEKTGVQFEGVTAINPANGETIPVFIADYVLARYGTGALMAVPAHDERDFVFAKKYNLPIKQVVSGYFIGTGEIAPRSEKDIHTYRASTAIVKHWSENKFYVVNFSETNRGFVGGSVESGESIADAATRETKEETGYTDVQYEKMLAEYHIGRCYKVRKNREEVCYDSAHVVQLLSDNRVEIVDNETRSGEWKTADEILTDVEFAEHHKEFFKWYLSNEIRTGIGTLVNSDEFNDTTSEEAGPKIVAKVRGKMKSTYKVRDWSISRQRYWGVPIPIVYDPEGKPHAVPQEHLPWTLPADVDITPTGEPPLAKSNELKERTERIFGAGWTPEVETMDTFVCSSWYYMRYTDPTNETAFASLEAQKAWMPIDIYFGGSEHTTMHLLYSRFVQKALFDMGLTSVSEPYNVRINRGLVLGPDGNKMSKSKGNVIDPDEQVTRMGADTVKMYLAFMGPYAQPSNYPWDLGGIAGLRRFLERAYDLDQRIVTPNGNTLSFTGSNLTDEQTIDTDSAQTKRSLHQTIAKVTADIGNMKFNTAISSLMIFVNVAEKNWLTQEDYETFLKLLAPFAPHLAEELWEKAGKTSSIHLETWPEADHILTQETSLTIAVQINGKSRETIIIAPGASQEEVLAIAHANESLEKRLAGQEIIKIIYVQDKILNLIVK